MKKKTAKGRATRSVKNLSAKTLTVNQARGVMGGFFKNCVAGKHIAKAILIVR